MSFLTKIFGSRNERILRRLRKQVAKINKMEPAFEALSDDELRAKTEEFRSRLANGETLQQLLPEAFATVREAGKRVLGMRHFDVQLIGGMVLTNRCIAEMRTGEGKTLTATLPCYLMALEGKGVHVVTVNDYLARRDAETNRPLFEFLGMTVGVNIPGLPPEAKREAYAADITYATNSELGFDYLRDNLAHSKEERFQRHLGYALVDEVDSILIDEARTPLIISGQAEDSSELYIAVNKLIPNLIKQEKEDTEEYTGEGDYTLDLKTKQAYLTERGQEKVENWLIEQGLMPEGDSLYSPARIVLLHHVMAALRANTLFERDVDYIVKDGEIVIVDEHTGRTMAGRRWSDGLHQAIEAKEGVPVQQESMTLATISFQNFFRLYRKLSGMTGTAFTEAEEFQQIYALDVIQIPPNRPIIRIDKDDLIFRTEAGKIRAIIKAIQEYHAKGLPILVGSASIVKNELIAKHLDEVGLKYEILNAKNNEREAAIIAKAGEKGAITLATNMAGRGTDIKLSDEVKKLGGLVVIGSERHDSRRVDNQLRGRGGRQGDPGITQFFVSCEDDLMRIFQGMQLGNILRYVGLDEDTPIQNRAVTRNLEAAQRRIEGFNFDSRKNVVQYDNVINRHRRVVYLMRRKILEGENISQEIKRLMKEATEDLTIESSRVNKKFKQNFLQVFNIDPELVETIGQMRKSADRAKLALTAVSEAYASQELDFGADVMRRIEREVYLKVLDALWMQHLENMQHLREGIHWRSKRSTS